MAGRSSDPAAFRTSPDAAVRARPSRPSRRQATVLATVFALAVGAVTGAALLVRPDDARSFDLFDGSVLLADAVAPVAVDLASGQPTVRLVDAGTQVGARRADDVSVTPMRGASGGALLLDRRTGQFNLVDPTGFVAKKNGGVPLTQQPGATAAFARATGGELAYVTQTGPGGSSVYLVGPGTVQGATTNATVQPRGFRSLAEQVSDAPGAATTAGNDFWLLAGTGDTRTVLRLSLPGNSAPGVRLRDHLAGRTDGPAAIAGGSGGTVALADGDGLRLWRGDTMLRSVRTANVPGLDTVLPASHSTSRLAFLLHGSDGWSTLSIGRDGSDVRGPDRVTGIGANAQLVAPAYSMGALYTADAGTGALWRVDLGGSAAAVTGASSYPVVEKDGRPIEAGGFGDTTVYAQGPRVVVNSPNHLRAVVVFTDGSRSPVAFTKSDATTISAGGGAEALTRSRNRQAPQQTPTPGTSQPTPRPTNPINNQVDCTSTSQTPHIPAIDPPVPGSRSVQLSWTYPVTDRTDCVPRTYVVGVRQLDGDGPAPPSRVTVDGQLGVNLTGLYPSSRYAVTVTAYLNGKGTTSSPVRVTTGPAGPTAPTGVTATVDGGGNWTVDWRGCGAAGAACVPAASWRVISQVCDTGGLTGAPATVEVVADPTSVVQPSAQVVGGDALLGRALRFTVEGIGDTGSVGTPSAASGCTQSWTAPNAAALRLSASQPGDVSLGTTTTTTLSLDLGSNAVRAAGGTGATAAFVLDGPGGTQTKTVSVDGRANVISQSFDGIRAGATYAASVRVSPPGHAEAGVVVRADAITTRAPWPALGLAASCDSTSRVTCDLTLRIGGISTDAAGGERFALADGYLQCGNARTPLDDFDQASWTVRKRGLSQTDNFYGACSAVVVLKEAADNARPLLFGGEPTTVKTDVDLGSPAAANAQSGDFTAAWSETGVTLNYTGNQPVGLLTTNWKSTVIAPNAGECGTSTAVPTPTTVPAGTCPQQYGDQTSGWKVRVQYDDTVGGATHTAVVAVADGAPPGYVPCTPTLAASWKGGRGDGVQVDAAGDTGGCGNWSYQLVSGASDDCGTATGAPSQIIAIACGATADTDWRVSVTWVKPDGSQGQDVLTINGTPPTD